MFAPGQNQLLANLSLLLFFKDLSIVRFYDFKKNFRGMCFTVQLSKIILHCRLSQTALLLYHVVFCLSRSFFNFFEVIFNFSTHQRQLRYLITTHFILSRTFFISFFNRVCQLQLWYNSIYFSFRQLPFDIFLHFLLYASYIIFSVPENELHLWCSPPESGWFLFPVLHFSCMLPEGLLW